MFGTPFVKMRLANNCNNNLCVYQMCIKPAPAINCSNYCLNVREEVKEIGASCRLYKEKEKGAGGNTKHMWMLQALQHGSFQRYFGLKSFVSSVQSIFNSPAGVTAVALVLLIIQHNTKENYLYGRGGHCIAGTEPGRSLWSSRTRLALSPDRLRLSFFTGSP